jgi:murein DD-endopeptidase MepM/ murein hydrolase activator NlpD
VGHSRIASRRRAASLILTVLCAAATVGLARADSHDVAGAKDRAAEAREREQTLAAEIASQSGEIDAVEGEIGALQTELAGLERRLSVARARLAQLERTLADKTRTIKRAGRELSVAQGRLSQRLVELYTSNPPDTLSVALGANSFEELVDIIETQEAVLEHDEELVGEIERLRARVIRERARTRELRQRQAATTAAVEQRTDERRSVLRGLVGRRDALAQLRSERQRSLASVRVERQEWEAQAAALAAASERVATVAAAPTPAVDAHVPTPTTSVGGFGWPVQGTIVSPYGQRWGRLHSGIDIAAPAGTPIGASAAGTVVFSGSMSGYGLLVVIQHAGDISTAYAHNSSNAVSVGQTVAQGQIIASVGCTGHCFGDHVHFEVRVGGSPVDPMGYL